MADEMRKAFNDFDLDGSGKYLQGLVFVENKFHAKVLYHCLRDFSRSSDDYSFVTAQYVVANDESEDEDQRRKQ